jgi:hypothetical protein
MAEQRYYDRGLSLAFSSVVPCQHDRSCIADTHGGRARHGLVGEKGSALALSKFALWLENAFESELVFDDCSIDRPDIICSNGYQTTNEHYRGMKL